MEGAGDARCEADLCASPACRPVVREDPVGNVQAVLAEVRLARQVELVGGVLGEGGREGLERVRVASACETSSHLHPTGLPPLMHSE